jgi:mycothiol system anti-sigma-R factor
MIDCREAVRRMWAYLGHDLEAAEGREFEEHLDACQRCCGELEFNRELQSLVATASDSRMPPSTRYKIDELLNETGDQPREG